MEEASGQELGWFFAQWLERAPSPALEWGWSYDAGTKKVRIDVTQTQAGAAYRLPLEVMVSGRLERIEVTQKQQHFDLAVDGAPAAVVVDPNSWVLMELRAAAR
jgi:aminopeptidase N